MKKTFLTLILCLLIFKVVFAQKRSSDFITDDVSNFWTAYDKIIATKDSVQQYNYLHQLFIAKGTPGLKAIMQARGYTEQSYIDAIYKYPLFWNSIRANTLKAGAFADSISANVSKLKILYPDLKPAKIYFTIGALRTGGTTMNDMVLIGSEIAMGDESTIASEFPPTFAGLKPYFKSNPINIIVFTNLHEYVHTQQKTTIGNNLLAQCVLEGVAEFMAEKATKQLSTLPALNYGRVNEEHIKKKFAMQMFNTFNGFWLYSNVENEFGIRDLGYYIGYTICEKYYNKLSDKKQAIKEMIELDYNDETALSEFVDQSGYFAKPINTLKKEFEESRPVVTGITPFKNNSMNVDTAIKEITVEFSTDMDTLYRNFELGPLGESNLLKIKSVVGFSNDRKSITFKVDLKPNQHYQLIIGDGFRNKNAIQLKPYLIDFYTSAR
jgi:hypothetical protein